MLPFISDICGVLCHQLPGRTPHFGDTAFPLCFRCAGLYLGLAASYFALAFKSGWRQQMPQVRDVMRAGVLMAPFLVDGWGNTLHLWSSPEWIRAATGLGYGVVLPFLLVPFTVQLSPGGASARNLGMSNIMALIWPGALGLAMTWCLMNPFSLPVLQLLAAAALVGQLMFVVNFLWATVLVGRLSMRRLLTSTYGGI